MNWGKLHYIVLDLETTGFDPCEDRIIEVGAIRCEGLKIVDEFSSLVNPGISLPRIITQITGLRDIDLRSAPPFAEVRSPLEEFCGDLPWVGHNIKFDRSFTRAAGARMDSPLIDTCSLARILFPNEASHSLEALAAILELKAENAHRALEDAKTAFALFKKLLERLETSDLHKLEPLRAAYERSSWGPAQLFLTSMDSREAAKPAAQRRHAKLHSEQEKSSANHPLLEALQSAKNTALEIPPQLFTPTENIAAIKQAGKKTTLATPDIFPYIDELSDDPDVAFIFPPDWKLDETRFSAALERINVHDESQMLFFSRILLSKHDDFYRFEMKLVREDYDLWNRVCTTERAASADGKEPLITITTHSLLTQPNLIAAKAAIIIESAHRLPEMLEKELTRRAVLSSVPADAPYMQRAELFFGLLGIFFEKFGPNEPFAKFKKPLILAPHHESLQEWKNLQAAAELLAEEIDCAVYPELAEFTAALHAIYSPHVEDSLPAADEVRWITQFYDDPAHFACGPASLDTYIEKIHAAFPQIIYYGDALFGPDGLAPLDTILHIKEDWNSERKAPPSASLNLSIPRHIPEPNQKGFFDAVADFIAQHLKEEKGATIVIFPSDKALAEMHATLEHNIPDGTKILSQSLSGGKGKIKTLYENNPEHSVIFCRQSFLREIGKIDAPIRTVISMRFQFPFTDPLTEAKMQPANQTFGAGGSSNGFRKYVWIPALRNFKHHLGEIVRAKKTDDTLRYYLLDSRLISRKDWNRDLQSTLSGPAPSSTGGASPSSAHPSGS